MKLKSQRHTFGRLAHTFLFTLVYFAFIYFLLPLSDNSFDDCSATPGHDYTRAIYIVPLYFILFGYWIFWLLGPQEGILKKLLVITTVIIIIPFLYGKVISKIFFNHRTIEILQSGPLYNLIYTQKCYGEHDLRDMPIKIFLSMICGASFLIISLTKKRNLTD
jgi:hypothetical protein